MWIIVVDVGLFGNCTVPNIFNPKHLPITNPIYIWLPMILY